MTTYEFLSFELGIPTKYSNIVPKIEEILEGKEYAKSKIEADEYVWEYNGDVTDSHEDSIEEAFILCLGLDDVHGQLQVDTESIEAPCMDRWKLDSKIFYQNNQYEGGGQRRVMMAGNKEWVSLDISKGEYKVLKHLLGLFSPDAERYAKEHKISLNISLLKYRLAMAKEHEPISFNDDDNED